VPSFLLVSKLIGQIITMSNLFDVNPLSPDKEYLELRDNSKHTNLKQYCEDPWEKFEPYADFQFRSEFATQPRHRFWEMYIGVYLLDQNFNLRPHSNQKGPDFHLIEDNRNIWIEATVPSEGTGDDAVPSPFIHDPNRLGQIPENKILLRFTNSVSEK